MCGIAGVLYLGEERATRMEVERMAAALRHRGPDGTGTWVSACGRCALAHTRLSVIDLDTGSQPMGNEDGAVQVVFNGEIYNFRELRRTLEGLGHRFRTRSDTEVLVHGWEAWGEALPEHLDGMFAFAVWDEWAGTLFLARDRAGKKPLFLYRDHRRLAFASEIKALLTLEDVDDTLDPAGFPLYLAYGYVPTPGTFYRAIKKVEPATWLRTREGGEAEVGRYWALDWTPRPVGEAEAVARVRDLLASAVERRLIADVPLGAFLSGGIDSTLVVGLMSRFMDRPVRTFSIGMADDPTYDETRFAALAAGRFSTEHTAFTVEANEVDLLDELVATYDEPFGDSSALPTYILSRLTRSNVTVALAGDGGDELFAGYARFLGMVLAERMPRWLVHAGDAVGRRLPHVRSFRHPFRRFSRYFEAAALPGEERLLRWIGFLPDRLNALLNHELVSLPDRRRLTESFRRPWERWREATPLARTLAVNFETYLLDDLLVKADRNSMAHGLELRSPFLDTALMEFAASLPDEYKVRRGRLKYLLRRAFPDLLPDEIVRRPKMGFGIPLPLWLRTRWRPLVEARLRSRESALHPWLRAEGVHGLVEEHLAGVADHGHALWALLTLESWLRQGRYSCR